MNRLYPVTSGHYHYDHIIGTGGIGSGIFYSLTTNETMGRNESRTGILLPYKDYCKQHIILHYIAVLLEAGSRSGFHVHPIGKVGDDETGRSLIAQMAAVGMDTSHVHISRDAATLFSVCYQYPDQSGGNITTGNSASNLVSEQDIDHYFDSHSFNDKRGIVLAVPEVPLSARIALMKAGRLRNCLNVASLLSAEVTEFIEMGGIGLTDLLAINIDEAGKIARKSKAAEQEEQVIPECLAVLKNINPSISVIITNGSKNIYCLPGGLLRQPGDARDQVYEFPALKVPVVSTAGAGDALIAGTICGLCCGLPLAIAQQSGNTSLNSAVELGILLAGYAVTSPDSIHPAATANDLHHFSLTTPVKLGNIFQHLFKTVQTV